MSRLCRLKTASHGDDGKWAYEEIVKLRAALEQPEQVGLTDSVRNAFLYGIRYSANKYEAVWEDRFTGGDVSNFLLMEAVELDDTNIARGIPLCTWILR